MATAFQKAYEQAIKIKPKQAAQNCGFKFSGTDTKGHFSFNFLKQEVKLEFPNYKGYFIEDSKELNNLITTIVMYHLAKSDGSNITGKWISYADLPGGQQYIQAMRGYTGKVLIKHFANNLEALSSAAKILGAKCANITGDLFLEFQLLPKIPIALVYWKGDDEFEPRAEFLFDESAPHHLPSDCYAVLCSWLTSNLIKWDFN